MEIPSSATRRFRLFCLPFAGGLASFYRSWAFMLPGGVDVLAWEYEGHGFRRTQPPPRSVQDIAHSLVRVVDATGSTPYAFFGHSMGAIVAFEACRIATQRLGADPSILFVSGCRAPTLPQSELWHTRSEDCLVKRLMHASSKDDRSMFYEDLIRFNIGTIRDGIRLIEHHSFCASSRLRCRIVAFGGCSDPIVPTTDLLPWTSMTTSSFGLRIFKGSHFFISNDEKGVVDEIGRELLGLSAAHRLPKIRTFMHRNNRRDT